MVPTAEMEINFLFFSCWQWCWSKRSQYWFAFAPPFHGALVILVSNTVHFKLLVRSTSMPAWKECQCYLNSTD